MDYTTIYKLIIEKLEKELSKNLFYHSVFHVIDVISAVEEIAKKEGISGESLILLKTAALFHDTGFLYRSENHEEKSCEVAQQFLPEYGYSQEHIDKIEGMIMATKIPQNPKNHLEKILSDADLDYLGRDDFFIIGEKLFDELKFHGAIKSEYEWNLIQEKFLKNHNFFTIHSIATRSKKKDENLNAIKSKLNKMIV